MRYLLKFSYDGACFNGFQKQLNVKTVQGVLEKALSEIAKQEIKTVAASRTDKGVHALVQYAHFDIDREFKFYNLRKYLNCYSKGEIYVNDIKIVDNEFHARYDVKSKKYCYYINLKDYNPTARNYVYQYCDYLSIDLMKEAVKCLIGRHDFRSFASDSKNVKNCVRHIYSIDFEIVDDVLRITFIGNGFLRKMIRNIVGVLILIGSEQKPVSYMKELLDNKKRVGNLKCAFAGGLYLEDINYNK